MYLKEYNCSKCGSKNFETLVENIHTGLYCCDCGGFHKWLGKNELNKIELMKKNKEV